MWFQIASVAILRYWEGDCLIEVLQTVTVLNHFGVDCKLVLIPAGHVVRAGWPNDAGEHQHLVAVCNA
jgi:hypothetical protein